MREETGLDERFDQFGLGGVLLVVAGSPWLFTIDGDGVFGFEKIGCGFSDEVVAVGVEGLDVVGDFVLGDGVQEGLEAVWVEVVGPDETLLSAGGNGKGAYAGHDIAYCFALVEHGA